MLKHGSTLKRAETTRYHLLYCEITQHHPLFLKTQLKPAKKYPQEHYKTRATPLDPI